MRITPLLLIAIASIALLCLLALEQQEVDGFFFKRNENAAVSHFQRGEEAANAADEDAADASSLQQEQLKRQPSMFGSLFKQRDESSPVAAEDAQADADTALQRKSFYGGSSNNNNKPKRRRRRTSASSSTSKEASDMTPEELLAATSAADEDDNNESSTAGIGAALTSSMQGPKSVSSPSSQSSSSPSTLLHEWERKGAHDPCWKTALLQLNSVCQDLLANKAQRTRLALAFMQCQLELDGKDTSPARCAAESDVASCASRISDALYPVYVQFSHHVEALCFHLQEELLHERTKTIVDRLGVASSHAAHSLADLAVKSHKIDASMAHLQNSHREATASAESLSGALSKVSHVGAEMRHALEESSASQKESVAAVTDKLTKLVETHASMQSSNEALSQSLKVLADDHVKAVGLLGEEVDETRRKLMSGIDGISNLQARTSGFIGSLDAALHYFAFFIIVWFVTTATRTQEARFAALLCGPVASILAERYLIVGFLKMFAMFGLAADPEPILRRHNTHYDSDSGGAAAVTAYLDPTPLRNFFILVALGVIAACAFLFETPEERQRRLLQLEIRQALNRALGRTSASPSRAISNDRPTTAADEEDKSAARSASRKKK